MRTTGHVTALLPGQPLQWGKKGILCDHSCRLLYPIMTPAWMDDLRESVESGTLEIEMKALK